MSLFIHTHTLNLLYFFLKKKNHSQTTHISESKALVSFIVHSVASAPVKPKASTSRVFVRTSLLSVRTPTSTGTFETTGIASSPLVTPIPTEYRQSRYKPELTHAGQADFSSAPVNLSKVATPTWIDFIAWRRQDRYKLHSISSTATSGQWSVG